MTTKVPVELSSTPGIADSSNATAITIDSSENTTFSGDVEVGTTAPKINLKNTDTSIVANQSLGVIEVESSDGSTGSAGTIAKLDIAASGTFDGSGHGSDFRFTTGATNQSGSISLSEKLRIQNTGGISFNGDTATANALDDYEEGTFTPNLRFGSTDNATTYDQTGQYTKIGNTVYVTIQFGFPNGVTTSDSGIAHVTNLPFTAISGARHIGPLSPYGMSGFGNRPVCRVGGGSSLLYLNDDHAGGFYVASDFATSAEMFMSITYQGA